MLEILGIALGVGCIVWGAERFTEHLAGAAKGLGVSTFALALLLAGAEPEELATTVTASLRGAPAISFGDVIGANLAVCLVALAVGAILTPLPFGPRVRRYAWLGLPLGIATAVVAWDGSVDRVEGAVLVGLYVAYVAMIWIRERQPPALGPLGEGDADVLDLIGHDAATSERPRIGEVAWVFAGVGGMVAGAWLLVESVRSLTDVEATQTTLALTVVGFATAFELVVLAWSAARRGITEAVVAAVVGSFAYNATMSLGAAALARPLHIDDPSALRVPLLAMVLALGVIVVLARRFGVLDRRHGALLLALYPVFVLFVVLR